MRPPKDEHSLLRYPLDQILGSEAAVRVLRVLLNEAAAPMGVPHIARLAGLSVPGARKALEALCVARAAERVGTAHSGQYRAKAESPFSLLLGQLFEQEEQEYLALVDALRDAVAIPEVRHAWMTERGTAIELVVVVDAADIGSIGPTLRTRVLPAEKQHDLIVEIALYTRADVPAVPADAIELWGFDASLAAGVAEGMLVREDPAGRFAMVFALAELVRSDPTLIRRALQHVTRLLAEGQGTANADLAEWKQLLEAYSAKRLADLLVSNSERAQRLWRSAPFSAVLTPEERERVARARR
jgi:hypothetical protein